MWLIYLIGLGVPFLITLIGVIKFTPILPQTIAGLSVSSVAFLVGVLATAALYELTQLINALLQSRLGSAVFGNKRDAQRLGLYGKHGLIIGQFKGKDLRHDAPGHLLTVSKTRGGKGVSSVIPNLLDHPGSVVCIDVKGENYGITARYRERFGAVLALSPFGKESASYNPLDFVRQGPDEIDDTALIASLIVVPGQTDDAFWEREARALLTGLIQYVIRHADPAKRNLAEVRRLLTQGPDETTQLFTNMLNSPHWWIRRSAKTFLQKEDKERSGVISTAQSHTKVFDSPRFARVTSQSDFDLEDLKRGVASLYVIVPPHQVPVYRPWLRLMVGLTTAAMTRVPFSPKVPVLFLLDEFPSLGRMPVDGFSYLAGYGVRLWVFTQSLGHIESLYGKKAETIFSNCGVLQAWAVAPSDIATAERLSKTLGECTVQVRQTSRSFTFRFFPSMRNYQVSKSPRTKRLLSADEILCLPDCTQLLFVSGGRPFLTERVRYFRHKAFKGCFDRWLSASAAADLDAKTITSWLPSKRAAVLPDVHEGEG